MVEGFNPWYLWGVAIGILILFLIMYRQKVAIELISCSIEPGPKYCMDLLISGYLKARHSEEWEEFKLCLYGNDTEYPDRGSNRPDDISTIARKFKVSFRIPEDDLEESRKAQGKDYKGDMARLIVSTTGGEWLSPLFFIPFSLSKGERRKLKRQKVKKRVGEEPCITKKEFRNLLEKAPRPVKKSEEEKS